MGVKSRTLWINRMIKKLLIRTDAHDYSKDKVSISQINFVVLPKQTNQVTSSHYKETVHIVSSMHNAFLNVPLLSLFSSFICACTQRHTHTDTYNTTCQNPNPYSLLVNRLFNEYNCHSRLYSHNHCILGSKKTHFSD